MSPGSPGETSRNEGWLWSSALRDAAVTPNLREMHRTNSNANIGPTLLLHLVLLLGHRSLQGNWSTHKLGSGSPCTGATWQRGTGTVPSLWGCQMRLGALASQPPFFSLPSFPLGTTGDTRLVPRLGLKAMEVICQRRATKRETVAWVSSLCAALLAL